MHALLGQSVILVDSLNKGKKELDEHVVLDVKLRKRKHDGQLEEHVLAASRVSCVSAWMPRDAVLTFETEGCQKQVMVHTPLRKIMCTTDIEEVRHIHTYTHCVRTHRESLTHIDRQTVRVRVRVRMREKEREREREKYVYVIQWYGRVWRNNANDGDRDRLIVEHCSSSEAPFRVATYRDRAKRE